MSNKRRNYGKNKYTQYSQNLIDFAKNDMLHRFEFFCACSFFYIKINTNPNPNHTNCEK